MERLLEVIAAIHNLMIAVGCFFVSLYIAPRFRFGRRTTSAAIVAKYAIIIYFLISALSRAKMAYLAWYGIPLTYDITHALMAAIQGWSITFFLVFGSTALFIRIYSSKIQDK